jgi:hypothetical protein
VGGFTGYVFGGRSQYHQGDRLTTGRQNSAKMNQGRSYGHWSISPKRRPQGKVVDRCSRNSVVPKRTIALIVLIGYLLGAHSGERSPVQAEVVEVRTAAPIAK